MDEDETQEGTNEQVAELTGEVDLNILRRQIRAARLEGHSEQDISDQVQAVTEFRFADAQSVLNFLDREEARLRVNDRRFGQKAGAVADFFAQLGEDFTLGGLSKVIGLVSPEAGEEFKQAREDQRLLNPKESRAIEVGSAFLGPAAVGPAVTRQVLKRGGGVLAADAAGAAVAGGATSGILGATGAEPGEAVSQFLEKGLIGALIAAPLGAVTGLVGRTISRKASRRSTSDRVIKELQEGTGATRGIRAIKDSNRRAVHNIEDNLFGQLDDDFAAIDDASIVAFVRRLGKNKDTKSLVRSTSPNLLAGNRLPGHSDLQSIKKKLRRAKRFDDLDELTELMDDLSPRFREANTELNRALNMDEAFDMGRRMSTKPAGDIDVILNTSPRGLKESRRLFGTNPEAQQMFRNGMVADAVEKLGQRNEEATATLKRFMQPGSRARDTMRRMFPGGDSFANQAEREAGDAAFLKFRDVLERELGVKEVNRQFRSLGGNLARLLPLAAVGAGFAISGRRSSASGDR